MQWKRTVLPIVFLLFATSLPQLYFWSQRGANWHGAYALIDTDEVAYSAYINALIGGRPRKNDPYTGQDGQYETLFSIQFLPAYAVAIPARLLHLSASTSFILIIPLATLATAIALFSVLSEFNSRYAPIGILGVLCLAPLVAINPLNLLSGSGYGAFPFVRRYIPALAFPLLLIFSLSLWRSLTRNPKWIVVSGVTFAVMVYSYFYLWTAALAWALILLALWTVARPLDRKRLIGIAASLIGMTVTALVPYFIMLSNRNPTIAQDQLMEFTHRPDLFRGPEIYAALILIVLYKQRSQWRSPDWLVAASFTLVPFAIFNQQTITGRSLQPFHYEEFVTGYWVLIALFLVWRAIPKRVVIYLAAGSMIIGSLLSLKIGKLTLPINKRFDQAAALKLGPGLVLAGDPVTADVLPTLTTNSVLWARHAYTFGNLQRESQRKRFFQYLYYLNYSEAQLAEDLKSDFTSRVEVFGHDRANPTLTSNYKPVSTEEIELAASDYSALVKSFDASTASDPILSYAVLAPGQNTDNLRKWYTVSEMGRYEGFEGFVVYRVKVKE